MKQLLLSAVLIPILFGMQIQFPGNSTAPRQYPPVPEQLVYPGLVNRFYQLNEHTITWMLPGEQGRSLREQLLIKLDSSFYLGTSAKNYHRTILASYPDSQVADSMELWEADRLFTDAAIALCKDVFQGFIAKPLAGYDQLSPQYAEQDNEWLVAGIINASKTFSIGTFIDALEPVSTAYTALKTDLKKRLETSSQADTIRMLRTAMSYYRWMDHFHFDKLIVVNLPSARLRYYEKDSIILDMKIVVGKTATPTPRFATYSDQAILYPYWYVPPSIIFGEYLPKIKNDPSWLDAHNMQVIDGKGKILDHHALNWAAYGKGKFPYSIRQSTGCDNALGVIKFNIISPYGVYLHDTNNKTAFLSGLRFYSHGCIRLEEPMELGNRLLHGQLDTTFLQSCFKEQKPVFKRFDEPVPVFSVYMPAVFEIDGKIRYYKDVYKLLK